MWTPPWLFCHRSWPQCKLKLNPILSMANFIFLSNKYMAFNYLTVLFLPTVTETTTISKKINEIKNGFQGLLFYASNTVHVLCGKFIRAILHPQVIQFCYDNFAGRYFKSLIHRNSIFKNKLYICLRFEYEISLNSTDNIIYFCFSKW